MKISRKEFLVGRRGEDLRGRTTRIAGDTGKKRERE